jgi:hypothetical protein
MMVGYAAGNRLFSRLARSLAWVVTVALLVPGTAQRSWWSRRSETLEEQAGAVPAEGETA